MGNFQCAKCGKPCHRLGGHLGERCGCHTGKLDHFDDEDDELDTLETDLDTARSEVARLTAEVEAMRGVVERIHNDINLRYLCGDEIADAALDALRARKVGG